MPPKLIGQKRYLQDLERDDILATLAYAAQLAHIKSTKELAA